jgi:pyridine nucleotide-disulfide oxidoreductase family protein
MAGEREVVLVGGGHAHVQVLSSWARRPEPDARLTLVSPYPRAVYSGMVPGVVAGRYGPDEAVLDLEALARRAGARLVPAPAARLDGDGRRIHVEGSGEIPFDLASCDVGSSVAGRDLPGVRDHAMTVRPMEPFLEGLDERLDGVGSLIVVGGGAAAVELAFCARARTAGRVTLVEAGPQVLPGFPPRAVGLLERRAAVCGVTLRTGARVSAVTADGVVLEDRGTLPAEAVIWAAGPAPHGLLARSGVSHQHGYARVRPTLQLLQHDEVFAAGDCAWLEGADLPRSGVHAVHQGPVLDHNLRARLHDRPLRSYRPVASVLALLDLGDGTALGTKWGRVVHGRWVLAWKRRLDRGFVGRFREG